MFAEAFSLASRGGRSQMLKGGTDPHPPIPVRDTTHLSTLSREAGLGPVINSVDSRLRVGEGADVPEL